jgi:uncharacterized protein YndB with AHSA1/START domain
MTTKNQTILSKDFINKKISVVREFQAPVESVWAAWTEASLLDQWWAPRPWKTVTGSMDFREGGLWLYHMSGPNGEKIWNRVDFIAIEPQKSLSAQSSFCDETGKKTSDLPSMQWYNQFIKSQVGTKVVVELTFAETADLEKIIEMGFQQGFTSALENLDEILEK